ncbi:glutathione transferase GstA [Microvirga sp. 17 mud 1-3]|uniref:glutathione transferase GstA n=1 Tax=Microvirga sp. 17 mud 1-3 TaxID=2082949 RepID=UPI000D6CB4D8|nr:glutathione transferase GstA [Microvirga sp. 17 mud 1-3]AWM87648.1 glutathione transferase GstA [Microvirga sp. 17 mud 1-3]
MKLYYAPGACSLAVHIVARETDIPLDLAKVDLARHRTDTGADLATVNPKNVVPALALDNGEALTEAAVILQWLAERAGRSDLLPAVGTLERYRVLEWLNFVATELHKGFSPWLWHSDTAEATKKAVHTKLALRFGFMEERLGTSPYLAGDDFTVADAYAFTILNWSHMLNVDLGPFPRLRAYLDRIASRPAVREAMQAEGLLKQAA